MDDATRTFERLRPRLLSIASRMLGSTTEAEVVVRDAYLRWREAGPATEHKAEAWLITIITRLCVNRLRRLNREGQTFGESRLLERLVLDSSATPEQMHERADDLSVALLALLERLPPEARTAVLLGELFEVNYEEVAQTIGKNEVECRQLVHEAKAQLRDGRPRYAPSRGTHFRLLSSFAEALASGDFAALKMMLSDDAELTGDGSGKVPSFGKPLQGGPRIAQLFFAGSLRYGSALSIELAVINGQWGLLLLIDGAMESAQSHEIDGERIVAIHVQRNPANLIRLAAAPLC
jgi:RNA polymerase sigma-70 factor (ECF subfamily)